MTPVFNELVIGGVMFAPVVSSVVMTVVIMLVLRPILRRTGFARLFASPAIAEFSLCIAVFSLLTLSM